MAPSKNTRTISQQAFESLVNENIDDLGMDPSEALADAIETLTLQGVDLSGIITCIPGSANDNPVIKCLDRLKEFEIKDRFEDTDLEEIVRLFGKLCEVEGSGDVNIVIKNGGLDLVIKFCSKIGRKSDDQRALVPALKALRFLLNDVQSTEEFRKAGGPNIVMSILNTCSQSITVLDTGFSVVAAAATGNELVKESFMDLKIDQLLFHTLSGKSRDSLQHPYDAIRALLTADDNRVLASQVFGYARRFAKIGIVESLVDALGEGIKSPSLVSASVALKAVAVNDEICMSIAECGGIDSVLQCIDDSGEQSNTVVAKACCSLLSKLAGSDANKSSIVQKGGMDRLIKLSCRLADDPFVLQEIMLIICTLCLRSPGNAARAVEAGAGDFAIQAMERFPDAYQMQKQSCLMIRNLVVRNQENRTILLGNGIEKIIRKAKENHKSCREAATDALRDLGLDNYNM
ncbi:hypothetical protein ACHQM5_024086 [Ranunculus cassubicifolius]